MAHRVYKSLDHVLHLCPNLDGGGGQKVRFCAILCDFVRFCAILALSLNDFQIWAALVSKRIKISDFF